MVVCQYFLRGQCKFGTQCRNDHTTQRPGAFGTSPWSLQNTSKPPLQLGFTVETVRKDLTEGIDRPLWPLTCFGASKHEPNLVAGMDESPEELRWRAVTALKSGNASEYEKYEQEKMSASRQLYANLLGNVTDTFRQAGDLSVANQRGVVQTAPFGPGGTNGPSTTSTTATSTPAATTTTVPTSAFGKPSTFASSSTAPVSAFGANSSTPTFGKPAFGQSAFGQPAFGQSPFGASTKPVSAFGAPSAFGQPSTTPQSAFGQPSTSTQSAFGQSSTPTQSAFGQATTPTSVFGQSSFGQPSQPQSSLIKPATAFGSTPATSSSGGGGFAAFAGGGTSAFASTSNAASTNSVFGRSAFSGGGNTPQSAFGVPTAQPVSAFSGTVQPTSAFGQTNNAPTSAFGQPNNQAQVPAFGQPSQPVSAFGSAVVNQQPQSFESAFGRPQNTQPVSAFGQPPIQPTSVFGQSQNAGATSQSVFGQGPSSSAFGSSLPPKPAAAAVGPPNFEAALASFSAKPGADKYDQMLPPNYADLIPAFAKEAFAAPKFEWGKIPDWVPPVQFR